MQIYFTPNLLGATHSLAVKSVNELVAQASGHIKKEAARWADMVKRAGVKVD